MARAGRYEIIDLEHADWRGMRFSSFERAEREWMHAVQPSDGMRFVIVDRVTKTQVWPEEVKS